MSDDAKRSPARAGAWLTLAGAAAAVAVLGGGGLIVVLNAPETTPSASAPPPPEPHGPPEPAPTVVAQREADDLRKLAKVDCDAARWSACVDELNRASDLDPQGNQGRPVQRMRAKAMRAGLPEDAGSRSRDLDAAARAGLAAALRADGGGAGLHVQLVCTGGAEPKRLCDGLAAAMKKAGWAVSRLPMLSSAGAEGAFHGERIQVATDADEATQAAADTLAEQLALNGVVPRGPDDMPPAQDAPQLRVTVGDR